MSTVTQYLADRHIDFLAFDHPRTYTSIAEARELGMDADEVAKTIVLDTKAGHVLAVIAASRRLDLPLTRVAVGDPDARLADEREIARDFPDYELGAIPPIGSLLTLPTYVDEQLATHASVVFASGRQTESVKIHVADLIEDPNVKVVPLVRRQQSFDQDWME